MDKDFDKHDFNTDDEIPYSKDFEDQENIKPRITESFNDRDDQEQRYKSRRRNKAPKYKPYNTNNNQQTQIKDDIDNEER